jgi:tetratricopeptide (TPR) repeat protein
VSSPETLARGARDDFQAGRYAEAREKLRQALKIAPRNPALWSYLGMIDAQLNDLDSAVADFRKTLALAPDDAQSYFNLGLLYGRKGDPDKATDAYQHGLKLEPGNATANQNYALLLMSRMQFRQALEPLKLLRGKDAQNLPVRAALIECYLKCGMKDEAATEIQAYMELPKLPVTDQLKLAKVLLDNNEPASAQALLENAVRTPPESPEAHYDLGILLLSKNQYENAVREFGRAVQLDPAPAQYSMRLAEALILWKHYGTALEFLNAVKDRFAALPDYRYKVGLAYYGLHRFPDAIAQFDRIARDQPNLELVHFFLGNSYVAVGNLQQAVAEFRKAIALQPRNAVFYTAIAQALRKASDDTDEAIEDLEKALSLDGSDAQSKQELALCLEKKRNYGRAQELLEQVIRQEPELVSAHVALARIYYRQRKKAEGDREGAIVSRLQSEEQARQSQLRNSPEHRIP